MSSAIHFKKSVLKLLQSSDYKPIKKEALANVLKVSSQNQSLFFECINQLMQENQIEYGKNHRIVISETSSYIKGKIKFKQNGSALFFQEGSIGKDPYTISKDDTNVALQGDTVLGRIIENKKPRYDYRKKQNKSQVTQADDSPSLRVLKVIQRARDTYIGTYRNHSDDHGYIAADDPYVIPEFIVPKISLGEYEQSIEDGDKVLFELVNWSQRVIMPEAKIIKILGKTHEPKAEFKAILIKYNLDPDFPDEVLKQANSIPTKVEEADSKNRLDLRNDYTFTIDPDDAKDFDDALSVKKINDDLIEIGVHIADVSAYVKPKTPLDVEAQNRGNSTYLVGTVIPMLPHSLSNGLCSLVEAEDRLTKSVIVQFNSNAEIQKVEFANTVIRSNKRLTYKQALAFMEQDDLEKIKQTPLPPKHQTGSIGRDLKTLDNKELSHLKTSIQSLWSIASKLRKRRFKKGSLDLDMNELKIYVDKEGYAERLEKQVNDISHQVIEEFMLVANEQVARLSKRERIASIYRVHDKPEDTRLVELRQIMRTYGVPCNQLSKPAEMSRLLQQLKEHPQSYALKLQVLKSLKQAQYRPTADGHYGLAKTDYSHFTSPIRRYSDLIVHRILDAYLAKSKSNYAPETVEIRYNQSTLESITQHLNITERNSVDAERESTKVKLLEYFEQELKIKPPNDFDAIITDVKKHGLFIELTDSQAFGFVHISKLGKDMYFISSNEQNIVGKRTRQIFSLGQRIKVNVLKVDRYKRQLDFAISAQSQSQKIKGISSKKGDVPNSPKDLNKLRKFRRSSRKK
ncbi:MAG: RNB domain-containing ribonuclease [Opitutae bacterium]|nr:RNB domain-containing ribonuclease [Opitutae bacterium]